MKHTLTKGYTLRKSTVEVKYITIVYDIGIFIDKYLDGKLENRTTRNTVNKANNLIRKAVKELEALGWESEEIGQTIVKENENKIPKFEEL